MPNSVNWKYSLIRHLCAKRQSTGYWYQTNAWCFVPSLLKRFCTAWSSA